MNLAYYKHLNLDPVSLQLLCLHAYMPEHCSTRNVRLFIKHYRLNDKEVRKKCQDLCQANLLEIVYYDWDERFYVFSINTLHRLPICEFLYVEHNDWLTDFNRLYGRQKPANPYVQLVDKVTKGDLKSFDASQLAEVNVWSLTSTLTDERYIPFLAKLSSDVLMEFVQYGVVMASENDCPELLNGLSALLKLNKGIPADVFFNAEEMLALYRYYAFGEYDDAFRPKSFFGILLQAARALYEGQYQQAVQYYTAALKIKNKTSSVKNILNGMMNCYLLVMAYVKEGSAESIKKLQQLLKKSEMKEYSVLAANCIGGYFTSEKRTMNETLLDTLLQSGSRCNRLFGYLFGNYITHASVANLKAEEFFPKQAILRHELGKYLPLAPDEKQELADKMGGEPLLSSIYVKQPWEVMLENLLQREEAVEQQKDSRIMYVIKGGFEIEVREQSRLKSGDWGAGKAVSQGKYFNGELNCMDETDRIIGNLWRNSGHYRLPLEVALPKLVGSDRVYTGYHAPFLPVTVTEEKPYLTVEKEENRLVVTSNFQTANLRNVFTSPTHITLKKDETHYVIFPLQGKLRNLYSQLLEQACFPLEAEEKLKNFFQRVGSKLEVHSPLFDNGCSLKQLEGQAAICVQVHPLGYGFRVLLYAKPLPDGKSLFVPGQGIGLCIDEKDGVRYQIKRKLKQEKEYSDALIDFIEENSGKTFRQNEVELLLPETLDLLEYIRPLSDTYFVEWPEGEKLRLKGARQSERWNIQLKSNKDWFEIEGEVRLDDDTVLSIAQLLELLGNSRGKYVRLNEREFLTLSDNLRKQLARLEAVAVKQCGKMQLTSFQAGLLGADVLNGELTIRCDEHLEKLREKVAESQNYRAKVPARLNATLRGYQVEGFQWIARLNQWGAGACLADDMGLGKTLQAIAYLLLMVSKGTSMVVAPASVVPNWRKELARFAPSLQVYTLNDCEDRKACLQQAGKNAVVLSSYGLLISEQEHLVNKSWNVVCLDEAHTIKNRDTKTSACVMQLQAQHRLILTGTPIQNHLGELWNLFQFINPGLLGSYEHFQQKFIQPIEQEHDKQRQLQLNRIVHPFMLRRTKQEVVEELPDKEDIVVSVELSEEEMAVYEVIRQRAKQLIEEGGEQVNVVTLAEITRLRQAACCASLAEKKWRGKCSKIDQLLELMAELKEGGNRALIFSQFTSFFKLICKALDAAGESYLYLDGSTSVKKREKLVQEFQEGDCPFFLISLKAGGLGLNLTRANYIIHLDPWWNPAVEQQATDRAYRIGQTEKVTAYHLIASHTIEEKILRLHESKRNLADALLEGTDMSHKLTAKELMAILEQEE